MTMMLNEQPRQQLKLLLSRFGISLCDNPKRCEEKLRQLCPEHKHEVDLLIAALNENVCADLLKSPANISAESAIRSISQRLQDNLFMAENFADWAVESWALALGIYQQHHPIVPEQTTQSEGKVLAASAPETVILPSSPTETVQQRIGKFIVREGIAIDPQTGLSWLRFGYGQRWENGKVGGSIKKVDWKTAFNVTKEFNWQGGYGGFTDWRLPTVDELETLLDKVKGKHGHCIDEAVFQGDFFYFWAIFPAPHGNQEAWAVNFVNGNSNYSGEYNGYAIRLVRGRQ